MTLKLHFGKKAWDFCSLLIPVVLFSASFFSCQGEKKELTDRVGNPLSIGKVVSRNVSLSDTTLIYASYLPKQYDSKAKLPVIFFFDPHGEGSLPLKKYQSLADTYGYIFIGSNNIKNGLSGTYCTQVFQLLLKETQVRFHIDEENIFTSGFSGGSKMAILFAQQFREVAGVIGCGGSLPFSTDQSPGFYYDGIVGATDFNYLEMQQSFSVYDQMGYDYTSVVFNGGHQWPPLAAMDQALTGIEIYRMKSQRLPRNEKWLDKTWFRMQDSLNVFEKKNDPIAQIQTLKQTDRWFNGLRNLKEIKSKEYALEQSQAFYQEIKKRQNYIEKEIQLRTEFIKAIELRDIEWWTIEVDRIHKSASSQDEPLAMVSSRLLNYISMASFMLSKTDLDDVKLDDAFKKIKIYELSDPKNPDVYLMYARYYLLMDNRELMVLNFKKALDSGFNSWQTYQNDSSWKELFEQQEIKNLRKN